MKRAIGILAINLLVQSCILFEKDERLLAEHKRANGGNIKIYFVGLGATTNDVIQVRKSSSEKPIWVSDKYNYLKGSVILNDTSLQLLLSDTGYHNYTNKPDTILVNIK